jgi:prepilin-type N-terminal cleavage/methylation domain-containing protein
MIGKLRPTSRNRGFTLTELMVVVAIIAIVAAAVVPSFSRTLQKNRQREAAMLIVEAVFAARSRAAKTGRCHRVRVMPNASGMAGGTGGAVALDESCANSCSAARGGQWNRLSYKSVWDSTESAADIQGAVQGDSHVGLIGQDVAISAVLDEAGGPGTPADMMFESTGGLYDMTLRFFEIRVDTGTGPLGVTRHVRVSAGGSVSYTVR